MKKVLFMAALFAATSVMFVGCKKKAAQEVQEAAQQGAAAVQDAAQQGAANLQDAAAAAAAQFGEIDE